MKVRPSVKPICEKCKIIRGKGKVMVTARTRSTSRSRANHLIVRIKDRKDRLGGCTDFVCEPCGFS